MNYRIVLNGLGRDCRNQAEELYGWVTAFLPPSAEGSTVIFHDGRLDARDTALPAPPGSVRLYKTGGYHPETMLDALLALEQEDPCGLYLFPGNFFGNESAVRFARRSGGAALTGITRLEVEGETVRCAKPVYSGRLLGFFEMLRPPLCLSPAEGAVDPAPLPGLSEKTQKVIEKDVSGQTHPAFFRSRFTESDDRSAGITEAPFLMIAGRGTGGREQCAQLRKEAEELKAAFGCSRPVAMSGWVPMDRMVGISGHRVQPDLCLTLGVSGSAALMAGIDRSGFIVSVNSDPKAPVAGRSDVAVIADYRGFMDALVAVIASRGR